MKDRAIVSERGTITIPKSIRKLASIHPGDLIEFKPQKNKIILTHLVLKNPQDVFMNDDEWKKFDKLVRKQLKKGQFKNYHELDKARLHSRNLIRQK